MGCNIDRLRLEIAEYNREAGQAFDAMVSGRRAEGYEPAFGRMFRTQIGRRFCTYALKNGDRYLVGVFLHTYGVVELEVAGEDDARYAEETLLATALDSLGEHDADFEPYFDGIRELTGIDWSTDV